MYARVILGRCVVQVGLVQWDDQSFVVYQCKVRACTLTTVEEIFLVPEVRNIGCTHYV